MKKLIFGKGINIITKNSDIKAILNDRFSLYPDFNEKEDIKLYINENEENDDFISINPNLHTSYPDGFKAKFGSNTIRWVMGQDVIKVYLNIPSLTKSWKNIISRYRSMEFSIGSKERIDQILYEMVLIPTMFFIDNLAIIHSAGFVYKNKSFLLGGTGGTGKTSASLEISKKNSALFLNDDMSIIDSQGFIYPNLAYPKIYAYNTIGDIELENKLIKHHSFLNKIHWKIKKKKNSEKVRRKISPKDLYGSVINEKVKLDFYIILFREKVSKMKITEINKESAINATISIMQSRSEERRVGK